MMNHCALCKAVRDGLTEHGLDLILSGDGVTFGSLGLDFEIAEESGHPVHETGLMISTSYAQMYLPDKIVAAIAAYWQAKLEGERHDVG